MFDFFWLKIQRIFLVVMQSSTSSGRENNAKKFEFNLSILVFFRIDLKIFSYAAFVSIAIFSSPPSSSQNIYLFLIIIFQALLLALGLSLAQEEQQAPRGRLRFKRPRITGVSNPEGIAQGAPIPLRAVPTGKKVMVTISGYVPKSQLIALT